VFGAAPSPSIPRWGWLAPVAAVFVVVFQLAVHSPGGRFDFPPLPATAFATTSLSNIQLSAYTPGWAHSDRNGPIRDTFEWTNTTVAPSTMRTLPVMLSMTNSLFD